MTESIKSAEPESPRIVLFSDPIRTLLFWAVVTAIAVERESVRLVSCVRELATPADRVSTRAFTTEPSETVAVLTDST